MLRAALRRAAPSQSVFAVAPCPRVGAWGAAWAWPRGLFMCLGNLSLLKTEVFFCCKCFLIPSLVLGARALP